MLVSHDSRLISKVCDEVWVVHNGRLNVYEGSFDEYRQTLVEEFEVCLFHSLCNKGKGGEGRHSRETPLVPCDVRMEIRTRVPWSKM